MSDKDQPRTDPQDADFGRAAKEKEEQLNRSLDEGSGVPADEPADERPRAGSKADPDQPAGER
ncbi:MAG TPA: hypothetical protein VG435_08115 [Acidimicrobiales bacterium]|jgi:hypothetical protein|nr:hypothetical protein [Acidimicrobiales bacterium]